MSWLYNYINETLGQDIRYIQSEEELSMFLKRAESLSESKYRSLNHVMIDLINMGEVTEQVYLSKMENTNQIYRLNNLVAVEMNILTVHEVNLGETYVDATVNLKMEWIDDRFRMRGHPNESLAFLDRPEVTDFRRISVDKIWTPDLSVEYYS